jgi:phosphotransferase system, enzyme I, PtsP
MPDRSETESRKLLRRLREVAGRGRSRAGPARPHHHHHRAVDGHAGLLDLPVPRYRNAGALCHRRAEARRRPQDPDEAGRGAGGARRARGQPRSTPGTRPPKRVSASCPRRARRSIPASSACRSSGSASGSACWLSSRRMRAGFSDDEIYALEVVAMVLAEMTELGAFTGDGGAMGAMHKQPVMIRGATGQEGTAEGRVWLHEARVVVTNPVADDPVAELDRLRAAVGQLRVSVDDLLSAESRGQGPEGSAGSLPDVCPFAWLAAADGRGCGGGSVRRGGGGKGTVRHPRPAGTGARRLSCATGSMTSTTCRTGSCGS